MSNDQKIRLGDELIEATNAGDASRVAELIAQGADGSRVDSDGMTALMHATSLASADIAKLLIPVSDTSQTNPVGLTALMLAAHYANPSILAELMPVSDVGQRALDGETALMLAVSHHTLDGNACAGMLLPQSDPTAQDEYEWTALDFTVYGQQGDERAQALMARTLLPISDLTRLGGPLRGAPLMTAVRFSSDACMREVAMATAHAGALDVVDADGMTALDHARQVGRMDRAGFIEALSLAKAERHALESMRLGPSTPRARPRTL